MCEVFNSKLVGGRDKPIITALEYIREYLMQRICNVQKVIRKCQGPLTPTATKIMERTKSEASQYVCLWNGGDKYQVSGPWMDQCVVDMKERTCTCRKWELSGISCKHVIAIIWDMGMNCQDVGEPETFVHKVYWLETWKHQYSFLVDPIKGRDMWPRSSCPTSLTPPSHHNQVGRPKKKIRKTHEELDIQGFTKGNKLTRKFYTVTRAKCHNKGHNSRTCKGQSSSNAKEKGKAKENEVGKVKRPKLGKNKSQA